MPSNPPTPYLFHSTLLSFSGLIATCSTACLFLDCRSLFTRISAPLCQRLSGSPLCPYHHCEPVRNVSSLFRKATNSPVNNCTLGSKHIPFSFTVGKMRIIPALPTCRNHVRMGLLPDICCYITKNTKDKILHV